MLEFRDLQRIEAIVVHGGFGKAARALGMTQPALTRSIAAAENALKGELFRRSRRGAEPTALCRMILADAPEILARMQALHDRLMPMRGGSGEELSVAAGPFPFETICLPAAIAFRRAEPRLRLRLETLAWPAAIARLRARQADLAVVTTHAAGAEDFLAHRFAPQPLVLAVRDGHPLARAARPTLAAALRHPLVTTAHLAVPLQRALAEARAGPAARRGADIPFPALLMESMAGWERVLRHSDAVALLTPAPFVQAIRQGDVVPLRIQAPWLVTSHSVLQLRGPAPPAAGRFLDALRAANDAALVEARALCPWLGGA